MDVIEKALAGLRLGRPQSHRNLALFPLIAEFDRLPALGEGENVRLTGGALVVGGHVVHLAGFPVPQG